MYVWFRLGPDPSGPSQGSRDWVGLSLIPKLFFYFCAVQGKLGLSLGSTRSIQMVYTSYDPLSFLYSNYCAIYPPPPSSPPPTQSNRYLLTWNFLVGTQLEMSPLLRTHTSMSKYVWWREKGEMGKGISTQPLPSLV